MSIVKTFDVFCDGVDADGYACANWTPGVADSAFRYPARVARETARQAGWTRSGRRDLCPSCTAREHEAVAQVAAAVAAYDAARPARAAARRAAQARSKRRP